MNTEYTKDYFDKLTQNSMGLRVDGLNASVESSMFLVGCWIFQPLEKVWAPLTGHAETRREEAANIMSRQT